MTDLPAHVVAVARDDAHRFTKPVHDSIRLIAGLGVEGDAHAGATVQHRSRRKVAEPPPNLRQVHLIHAELLDEINGRGYDVTPGGLGENITTRGVDLLALPVGTRLQLGETAVVELTGLRNPCTQIDRYREGLMKELVHRDDEGRIVRLAGVMSVVAVGGVVRPGDRVVVTLPAGAAQPLQAV